MIDKGQSLSDGSRGSRREGRPCPSSLPSAHGAMLERMTDFAVHRVSPEQRVRIGSDFSPVIAAHPEVAFAFLFGSVLEREEIRDIDVGVYRRSNPEDTSDKREEPQPGNWSLEGPLGLELEQEVLKIVGSHIPVDVRVMNAAPLYAQYAVLTGELIHLADEDAFARVVEDVVPRYLDLEPLRSRAIREVLGG